MTVTVLIKPPQREILTGDALALLKTLPAESVQACVTSPPYWGLRDYGVDGQIGLEESPDAYVAKLVAVFREVRRVLKEDGLLWLNLGDSYARDAKKGQHRPGDSGKQAAVYDRGGGRASATADLGAVGLKPKDLVGIPWRVAFALRADGWWLRSDIIWHKPNVMPESVTDRVTKAHEYVFMLSKSQDYHYDVDAVREPHEHPEVSHRSTKKSAAEEAAFMGNAPTNRGRAGNHPEGRNRRSVWSINTKPYREAHFATFPTALVEPCVKASTRPGDVVLDPFFGAGTVGVVAKDLCRGYVGIELNPEYVTIAKNRIG